MVEILLYWSVGVGLLATILGTIVVTEKLTHNGLALFIGVKLSIIGYLVAAAWVAGGIP